MSSTITCGWWSQGRLRWVASSAERRRFNAGQFLDPAARRVGLRCSTIPPAERNLIGAPGSYILGIPRAVALSLLEAHPSLYPTVLKIEANRFRAALNLQQHNLVRERPRRVAGLLLMLMEMSGEPQQSAVIRLTSQQLARMAHCSRQSLYEAVKALAAQGCRAAEVWSDRDYRPATIARRVPRKRSNALRG